MEERREAKHAEAGEGNAMGHDDPRGEGEKTKTRGR